MSQPVFTPKGSATPTGNLIPSFPLMPQGWPLSSVPGDGVLGNLSVPAATAGTLKQTATVQADSAAGDTTATRRLT